MLLHEVVSLGIAQQAVPFEPVGPKTCFLKVIGAFKVSVLSCQDATGFDTAGIMSPDQEHVDLLRRPGRQRCGTEGSRRDAGKAGG